MDIFDYLTAQPPRTKQSLADARRALLSQTIAALPGLFNGRGVGRPICDPALRAALALKAKGRKF